MILNPIVGGNSFVSSLVAFMSKVLGGGGGGEKKMERGFPWLREAQSFSCETQYPWLNPKHGAVDARLPSKENKE